MGWFEAFEVKRELEAEQTSSSHMHLLAGVEETWTPGKRPHLVAPNQGSGPPAKGGQHVPTTPSLSERATQELRGVIWHQQEWS